MAAFRVPLLYYMYDKLIRYIKYKNLTGSEAVYFTRHLYRILQTHRI
jgi:hypothetical protein